MAEWIDAKRDKEGLVADPAALLASRSRQEEKQRPFQKVELDRSRRVDHC